MEKRIMLLLIAVIISVQLHAQIEAPVKWSFGAKKINNTEAVIFIKADIQPGWHIYSTKQKDGGPVKTSFVFNLLPDYDLIGKIAEPIPHAKYEEAFDMKVYYFEKQVIFQQKIKLNTAQTVVKGKLNFMVCNEQKCIPAQDVEFSIPVK